MSSLHFKGKFAPRDGKRAGVALVTTLAMVAIVSLMLVAFVTMMKLDRSATQSYAQSVKAESLAAGSLRLITKELQKEMAKDALPDVTVPAYPVYTNIVSANLRPQRVGTSTILPDPMPNLVKISTNTIPSFTGTLSSGAFKASTVSTTTPSQNGRYVSRTRWQQICLGDFPDDAGAPHWVIMTRSGPTDGAALTFGTTGDTLDNPASANPNYAIGRFAYAIYDEGGLLNVNTAGYPANSVDTAAEKKGNLPWSDLAQIPGVLDSNALVQWRNASTGASKILYSNYISNFATPNGFGIVAPGDTTFLSRGDLIHYAKANPLVLSSAALPYLSTFSRDLTGPTWGPTSNGTGSSFQYQTNADDDGSVNRFFPNVRVTTAFTRMDGSAAKLGEPLVTKRFPLSRLSLITYTATANDTSNIFKYFGLKRSLASDPWAYCNSDGSPALVIKTLKQVANEAREPNFFELLYACILNGSLGQYNRPPAYSYSGSNTLDSNPYIQAIRIGANIIDQADTDNYPTIITYGSAPPDFYKFYGIEDIPYPNKILLKWVTAKPITATNPAINWCTKFNAEFFFEMWNPHQQLAVTGSAGPTEFRVVLNPMATYAIKTRQISSGGATIIHGGIATNPISGSIPSGVSVRFNVSSGSYREPSVVYQDSAVTPPGDPSILSFPTSPTGAPKALGYKMQGPAMPGPNPPVTTGNSIANLSSGFWAYEFAFSNVMFSFQQKDSFGNWQTYATSSGLEELPASGLTKGTGAAEFPVVRSFPSPSWTKANTLAAFSSYIKSDPRTSRFGVAQGYADGTSDFQVDNPLISSTGTVSEGHWGTPFDSKRLDLMAFNQPVIITGYKPYNDADGINRPGDSYLEDPNSWETNTTAQPPMKGNVTETRPIILNRPFRSVGELGYVFRDMPWKTLDLFSPKSADIGLMDVFSINDSSPMINGRVNLNTRNPEVLKTLLTGIVMKEATATTSATLLDAAAAEKISQEIVSASTSTSLIDFGDLASRIAPVSTALPSKNKMEREAVMRALVGSTSTRTWNLLIDLVAQVGKYPTGASGLEKFLVEGERHYWMHVAIDRYTGQILDQSLELVDE